MNEVVQRIERIRSIFLETQSLYAKQDNMDLLLRYLENTDPSFRSIAYESASMAIALNDLENNQELNEWLLYATGPASAHKAQVHVGLGWAIAKLNLPFLSVVGKIEPGMLHRVADGCGYYDGSFRQRQTLINQQLPVYLPEPAMPLYDQGIGRSLWYTNNADIDKVRSRIDSFPGGRHADLWRGIGIAVAYVGGCDEDSLETLLQYATINGIQLAFGAALAAGSRMEARTVSADTDRCSRFWYELIANKTNIIPPASSDKDNMEHEEIYFNWMKEVEKDIADRFQTGQ